VARARAWLPRALAVGIVVLALPVQTGLAANTPEPIFGTATGETETPGSLTPIGNGRFATEDRVYAGRILGRSVVDDWADCFTGRFTSSEDWSLEAPKMIGTHQSMLTIRSERGSATLQMRGSMEFPAASGTWEIARTSGSCAGLAGEGRYTATFSSTSPEFRLTYDGLIRK
jgi:hypothetical protein